MMMTVFVLVKREQCDDESLIKKTSKRGSRMGVDSI